MANRTGQSENLPSIDTRVGVSGASPRVRYSSTTTAASNAGQAEFSLAETLRQMSSRMEDRLDIIAATEARREGAFSGSGINPPRLKDESTIRGRAYNEAAKDVFVTNADLNARKALNEYENEHSADPVKIKEKGRAYLDGVLPDIMGLDPQLAQRYRAEFELRLEDAAGRALDRQKAIARDRQLEDALRHQMAIQDDLAASAAELFSGDGRDARVTFDRLLSNAAALVDTSSQIGPDGRPLFSAQQRVAAERDAEKIVSQQVGLAWMRSQPDMITAFNRWQNEEATFELVDDEGNASVINLKDVLGVRGYQAAESVFFEELRSELALRNQVQAQQDRAFEKQSDALFSDMQTFAQDGALSLSMVEAARSSLEPDRYIALREIAKGGFATVSDGVTISRLIEMDAAGQDIRGDLRAAKNDLTQSDYTRLYERNASRLKGSVRDPVLTGRDFVSNSLGKLSSELGMAQSVALGDAEAEYEVQVTQFIEKEGRQPTVTEALDIGRKVRDRFSVISVDQQILMQETPKFMTAAQKYSSKLSAEDLKGVAEETRRHFLEKHSGNQEAMKADPEYQNQSRLLKKYMDLISAKGGSGE